MTVTKPHTLIRALLFSAGTLVTTHGALAQHARIAKDGVKVYALPAKEQPVVQVLAKGDTIRVLGQRNNWVKVQARGGKKGWLLLPESTATAKETTSRRSNAPGQQNRDASVNGTSLPQNRPEAADLIQNRNTLLQKNRHYRRFGYTFGIGMLETDFTYNWKFIFHQTPRLALEGSFKHALGNAASSYLMMANLSYLLSRSQGRDFLPFVTGGLGVINTVPERSVDSRGVSHMALNYGLGARKRLSRRMSLLANISQYTVFVGKGINNFREVTVGLLVGTFWD